MAAGRGKNVGTRHAAPCSCVPFVSRRNHGAGENRIGRKAGKPPQQLVAAITKKNNHLFEANELRARVGNLQDKAELAETRGDTSLARDLRQEYQAYEELVTWSEAAMRDAEAKVEEIKRAAWRDEETLRQKLAEAITLQTEMRVLELQKTLADALNTLKTAPDAPENWDARKHVLTTSPHKLRSRFCRCPSRVRSCRRHPARENPRPARKRRPEYGLPVTRRIGSRRGRADADTGSPRQSPRRAPARRTLGLHRSGEQRRGRNAVVVRS